MVTVRGRQAWIGYYLERLVDGWLSWVGGKRCRDVISAKQRQHHHSRASLRKSRAQQRSQRAACAAWIAYVRVIWQDHHGAAARKVKTVISNISMLRAQRHICARAARIAHRALISG
jgi:hypothetical protein